MNLAALSYNHNVLVVELSAEKSPLGLSTGNQSQVGMIYARLLR